MRSITRPLNYLHLSTISLVYLSHKVEEFFSSNLSRNLGDHSQEHPKCLASPSHQNLETQYIFIETRLNSLRSFNLTRTLSTNSNTIRSLGLLKILTSPNHKHSWSSIFMSSNQWCPLVLQQFFLLLMYGFNKPSMISWY